MFYLALLQLKHNHTEYLSIIRITVFYIIKFRKITENVMPCGIGNIGFKTLCSVGSWFLFSATQNFYVV